MPRNGVAAAGKNSELRLIAKEGIVIMAAKLLPLREMTVVYTSKELTKLSTVVEKLCCRMSLIIAEPDLKQRLAQENGTYDFRKLPAYKMAVCRRWPFAIFLGRFMWSVKPGSNFCSSRKKRFCQTAEGKIAPAAFDFEFFKPVLQKQYSCLAKYPAAAG